MNIKDHGFFRMLELAEIGDKRAGKWGLGQNPQKLKFFSSFKEAHPFVFDKRVTVSKRYEGRCREGFENVVEDFSLPFKNTIYLLTDAPVIISNQDSYKAYGYLIHENNPESFTVWTVGSFHHSGKEIPLIESIEVDLRAFETITFNDDEQSMTIRDKDGNMEYISDDSYRMHEIKETGVLLQLSKAISVKRIGKEYIKTFSVKSRGVGTGYTSLKSPNLYHIADKREYEYLVSDYGGDVQWEWSGHWRGHWRAFYCKNKNGKTLKDPRGLNKVDYLRVGKNRLGEYTVKGYTWVVEHIKGDQSLAEIKTHFVKKETA